MAETLKAKCPACAKSVRVTDTGGTVVCPACGHRFDAPSVPLLGPVVAGETLDVPAGAGTRVGGASTSSTGGPVNVHAAAGQLTLANQAGTPSRSIADSASEGSNGVDHRNGNGTAHHAATLVAPVTPADRLSIAPAPSLGAASVDSNGSPGSEAGEALRGRSVHPLWWVVGAIAVTVTLFLGFLYATGRFDSWEDGHRAELTELKVKAERLAAAGRLGESHEAYQQLETEVAAHRIRDPAMRAMLDGARADQARVYAVLLARQADQSQLQAAAQLRTDTEARLRAEATAASLRRAPSIDVRPPPRQPVNPSTQGADTSAATRPDSRPAVTAAPATHVRAPIRPVAVPADLVTDARIGSAIRAGVDSLLARYDPNTNLLRGRDNGDDARWSGLNSLVLYALLQCGQAIDDDRVSIRDPTMKARLEALKKLPIEGHDQTYARALRSTCLALFDRRDDYPTLRGDADWLVSTTNGGAYTYSGKALSPTEMQSKGFVGDNGPWDNSNSQYGLLGVWSAIDADPRVEVPSGYWKAVEKHWTSTQLSNGEWGYHSERAGRLSMTAAGIASLFVAHEYIDPGMATQVGRDPYTPALKKALDWFEQGNNAMRVRESAWWGYGLYGIERVGLASGFKQFGSHDWYRELAAHVLERQGRNGDWGRDLPDTAYALLFLSRGRHPILMNKVRFDGHWANRPRDLANLARFASRQLERPLNWQVVNLSTPWTQWTDSTILYIASHEPPPLDAANLEKLRAFSRAGGLIFTHADAGSPKFNAWAAQLATQLFPDYPLSDLPADHLIYTVVYRLESRPPLKAVSNGSRVLMLHSPTDLAVSWQQRLDRAWERSVPTAAPAGRAPPVDSPAKLKALAPFHLGVNLFIYAGGKRDLRNRLDATYIAPVTTVAASETMQVARLQYAGNWDPEPGAWERYVNALRRATGYKLEVAPVKIADLLPSAVAVFPLAHLTGTAGHAFTDAEVAAIRGYVEAGGVLLIDSCGGPSGFEAAVRDRLLPAAFPGRFPQNLPTMHPLLNLGNSGMEDLTHPRTRAYTFEKLGSGVGTVAMLKAGKGHVILPSLDLTSGLLGTSTWGILGFEPKYAQSLLTNVLLWTLDGQAE